MYSVSQHGEVIAQFATREAAKSYAAKCSTSASIQKTDKVFDGFVQLFVMVKREFALLAAFAEGSEAIARCDALRELGVNCTTLRKIEDNYILAT